MTDPGSKIFERAEHIPSIAEVHSVFKQLT